MGGAIDFRPAMPSEGGSSLILGVFFGWALYIFDLRCLVKVVQTSFWASSLILVIFSRSKSFLSKMPKLKKKKKFNFSKSYLTFLGSSRLEPKSSNFDPTLARFLNR